MNRREISKKLIAGLFALSMVLVACDLADPDPSKSSIKLQQTDLDFGNDESSMIATIINNGDVQEKWSANSSESFISVEPQTGTIAPNQETNILVKINRNLLAPGNLTSVLTLKTGNTDLTLIIHLGVNPEGPPERLKMSVLVHLQDLGDKVYDGCEWAGTIGQKRRLEGFELNIFSEIATDLGDLSLEYMAHIAGIGDTPWIGESNYVGTRDQGRAIEGFAIRLTGSLKDQYNVLYQSHVQKRGYLNTARNGEYLGTRGEGLRVEAIKVCIEKK